MAKPSKVKKIDKEIGVTTEILYSGFAANKDYNNNLKGPKRIKEYDKMRLGDATVRACLHAIKLPILRASWYVEPAPEDPQAETVKTFIEDNLFNQMSRTWAEFLGEALTYLPHGNAIFELAYEFSEDGKIRLKKFARRPSDTIYDYKLSNGDLGVVQKTVKGTYEIPIEKLLILVNEKEGDNWEGVSILRSAYRNWYIKDKLLQIDAIAAERQGLGVPLAELPAGTSKNNQPLWDRTVELLENLRANEKGYLIKEVGTKIEFMDMKASTTRDLTKSLSFHNREITKSVLADFLELGATATGSYALSQDKTEMFLLSLEAIAEHIAACINEYVIKRLVDLNFNVKAYPKLKFAGIQQADLEKMSVTLATLANAGIVTVDDTLEDHVRNEFNLPERQGVDDVDASEHGPRSFRDKVICRLREDFLSEIKEMKEQVDRAIKGDEPTPTYQHKL